MKTWQGALLTLLCVAMAVGASAQTKGIGVYWDQAATQTTKQYGGVEFEQHTFYLIAVNAEQTVGGAAFTLQITPTLQAFPEFTPGMQVGDWWNGIEVGFTDCYLGYFGVPVLLATFTAFTPLNFGSHVMFEILPHPTYDEILLADCEGTLSSCAGFSAMLESIVDTEDQSWGAVKNLYQ